MLRVRIYSICAVTLLGLAAAAPATTIRRVYADAAGDTAYDVAVGDGYAYVSCNGGISIYDVRDPENPHLLTHPSWSGGPAFGLWLDGALLYAAAISNGLLVADVSNPANPVILSRYGAQAGSVVVHRNVAYVSGFSKRLELVDVSDPANPARIAELGWVYSSGAAGITDHVFVTDPGRGIVNLNVADPAHPSEIGILVDSAGAYRLEIRGTWLIAALYSRGIRAYDVSDPLHPQLVFTFRHSGEAWDVSGEYPILCVGDLQEGVEIVDASAPYARQMAASDGSFVPHALEYANSYIHLADQDEGYVLLRLVLDP